MVNKEKTFGLLLHAVKQAGSYAPLDVLYYIEEQLTIKEYESCEKFLQWVCDNDENFGHGNLPTMWEKCKKSV